jgi:hypothetical protein
MQCFLNFYLMIRKSRPASPVAELVNPEALKIRSRNANMLGSVRSRMKSETLKGKLALVKKQAKKYSINNLSESESE